MIARSGLLAVGLLAAQLGCHKQVDSGGEPGASRSSAPPAGDETPSATGAAAGAELGAPLEEAWRLELASAEGDAVRPVAAVGLPDGDLLVAWNFSGRLVLPGRDGPLESAGEDDVLVTRVGAGGTLEGGHRLGGPGDDEVVDLVLAGDTPVLALRSDGALTVGARELSPPPAPSEWARPRLNALVHLDGDGRPASALAVLPNGDPLAVLAVDGGDLIVAGGATDDELDHDHTMVERWTPGGTRRWATRFDGGEVSAIVAGPTSAYLATRTKEGLGLERFDADSGKLGGTALTLPRLGGDWGALVGGVVSGGALTVYGHAGREVVVQDGEARSHPIEPIAAAAEGGERVQLADVVGSVDGVGLVRGQPVVVISALHDTGLYGGTPLPHRGLYVLHARGDGLRFAPVWQVDYADEAELTGKTIVRGTPMDMPSAAIAGEAVYLLGHCRDESRHGCVAKVELATP